jgi:hypothetical protein
MSSKAEILARMDADAKPFNRTMKRSRKSVKRFASDGIKQLGRFAAAFAGLGLIKGIMSLGTAAAETSSKFNAVFGPAAAAMNEKISELRKTIPSTTAEMQNSLATFAQMAKAFGLNEEAAGQFSVEMVKIAGDIASFNNLPIEEAFGKIRSAISGEFEPMKQLGIVINQTRLEQEALNLSIWDGTGQMSAAQKALAVQSILIRDMGKANGDAASTADSAANRIKFLRAEIIDTGTQIGVTALPALSNMTKGLATMLEITEKATDALGTLAGELTFGPTEETIARQQKQKEAYDAERQAIEELTKEGKLYQQGMFESVLWTEGLSEKLENNKRLIEERKNQILAANKAQEQSNDTSESAEAARKKAAEREIMESQDLAGELENQIEAETDPARKKALEQRLAAYEQLLATAGELESLQKSKPEPLGAVTGSASENVVNRDAEPSEEASSENEAKGIQVGKIETGRIGENSFSRFGPRPTMSEREAAAGLQDTMSGRMSAGTAAERAQSAATGPETARGKATGQATENQVHVIGDALTALRAMQSELTDSTTTRES